MACSFTASVLCICAAASYLVFRVIAIVSNRLYIARAHFFGGCSVLCWCFGVAQMQSKKFLVFSFFLFLLGRSEIFSEWVGVISFQSPESAIWEDVLFLVGIWGQEIGSEIFHASSGPCVRPEVSKCRQTKATEASKSRH
uniref:Uncharacterized protein n=1 Tax=Ixodes ricinus TaxID=34613 RepID=A0A090XA82_IXORI